MHKGCRKGRKKKRQARGRQDICHPAAPRTGYQCMLFTEPAPPARKGQVFPPVQTKISLAFPILGRNSGPVSLAQLVWDQAPLGAHWVHTGQVSSILLQPQQLPVGLHWCRNLRGGFLCAQGAGMALLPEAPGSLPAQPAPISPQGCLGLPQPPQLCPLPPRAAPSPAELRSPASARPWLGLSSFSCLSPSLNALCLLWRRGRESRAPPSLPGIPPADEAGM